MAALTPARFTHRGGTRVTDRETETLRRNLSVALASQHKFRIAFMLFASDVMPDRPWQEVWVAYLTAADKHIGGA